MTDETEVTTLEGTTAAFAALGGCTAALLAGYTTIGLWFVIIAISISGSIGILSHHYIFNNPIKPHT